MLLLLFLLHLVTKNGSATLVALPLVPRTSTDTCDDINNCRKLFDIVWGCLTTIFACTWVSVHPNVPPLNQSRFALFWRRLKMMLIGIIAPEIMVGFAARQFSAARMSSKKYGFSGTHGFFFCMGGFVTSTGCPVTTKEQLEDPDVGSKYVEAIRSVDTEDIKDKSKGDALSKGVAIAQSLWFTTQCLARVHQHLVVTELEVATLAFAVVNVFIWLLWWNKPLDVQRPMAVGPPKPLKEQPLTPAQISRVARFFFSINGTSEPDDDYGPPSSTSVPSFWSPTLDDNLQFVTVGIMAFAGSVFGAIHCAASNTDFPTAAEMWVWRSGSQVIAAMPAVAFLMFLPTWAIHKTAFEKTKVGTVIADILAWIAIGAVLTYIPTRLILIPLPFAALRSPPQSAFVDVDWSAYIPHI